MSELPFLTGEQGRGPLLVTLFFISAALVTVWGIWGGTLPASDEAVLAESAREILVEDEVWMMHFDGKPIYDTPPLALWLMAFTMRIFGTGELGACLPFVIFSVLTFYLVFLAGGVKAGEGPSRQWITRPRAVGFLSAIILAASPLFGKFAPHIVLDVPFAFFVML
ncbi:MAG: glycosyltransferase family 39 protein, partial [Candidatus Krumholzibacteria bacterium]|nr:glycosyltransferase family 39 protein [Candidatus Krumholzibacteria bacterium]